MQLSLIRHDFYPFIYHPIISIQTICPLTVDVVYKDIVHNEINFKKVNKVAKEEYWILINDH